MSLRQRSDPPIPCQCKCQHVHVRSSARAVVHRHLLQPSPPASEMFLSKLPSPPRPWRPCLLAEGLSPRIGIAPFRRRRQLRPPLAASSSGSHSKDSPLPPTKPSSSKKARDDELGRWKSVPPGMRDSAVPDTEEPARPPRWSARRMVRAARRMVVSWVPRKARSIVLLNLVTFIFGTDAALLTFLGCTGCPSSV